MSPVYNPKSLFYFSSQKLFEMLRWTSTHSVKDIHLVAQTFNQLPVTVIRYYIDQLSYHNWIAILILVLIKFRIRTVEPWLLVYYILCCFSKVLADQVFPFRTLFVKGFKLFSKKKDQWENLKKIKIFLCNYYTFPALKFLTEHVYQVTSLTIARERYNRQVRKPRERPLALFQDKYFISLFASMTNLEMVDMEACDHRVFNLFIQAQKGTKKLIYLKYRPNLIDDQGDNSIPDLGYLINSLKSIRYLDIHENVDLTTIDSISEDDDPPQLEKLRIHRIISDIHSEMGEFLNKCFLVFPKLKTVETENFKIKGVESWDNGSCLKMKHLEIEVSCLHFRDVVRTIVTKMPNVIVIVVQTCAKEKILGDPEEIEAIQCLNNIEEVKFQFNKVSPLCLKAALELTNVKRLEFEASLFTEMDFTFLRECFQNCKIKEEVHCCLSGIDESERRMWYQLSPRKRGSCLYYLE